MIFWTFFCFLRPAFGHGRLGHPQSLEYLVELFSLELIQNQILNFDLFFWGGDAILIPLLVDMHYFLRSRIVWLCSSVFGKEGSVGVVGKKVDLFYYG